MATHTFFHLGKFLIFSFALHLLIIGAGLNHAFYSEKPETTAQTLNDYEVEVLSLQHSKKNIEKKIKPISDHKQSSNISSQMDVQIPVGDAKTESYGESNQFSGLQMHVAAPIGHNRPPLYPLIARQRGWEGKVVLAVEISSGGLVTQIKLESSSGHALLDSSAESALKHWIFQPATQNGIPIESQLLVPILFHLKGTN